MLNTEPPPAGFCIPETDYGELRSTSQRPASSTATGCFHIQIKVACVCVCVFVSNSFYDM